MSETRKPFLIGAFLLGGLALLVAGLFTLTRDRWFSEPNEYVIYFTGALDGLDVGADVTYRGVKVGSVREIRLSYDPQLKDVVMPVIVQVHKPGDDEVDGQRLGQLVQQMVERGLRAQLQTPSLLTGKAIVALDLFPDEPGYVRTPSEVELPVIPSVPSRIDQAADVLQELVAGLRELPLKQMSEAAIAALQGVERLSNSAELAQSLTRLNQLLGKLDNLSGGLERDLPPLMADARASGADLRAAVGEIRRAAHNAAQALDEVNRLAAASQRDLGPQSTLQYETLRALQELSQASKALQRTVEGLDQQPQSLIFGKQR